MHHVMTSMNINVLLQATSITITKKNMCSNKLSLRSGSCTLTENGGGPSRAAHLRHSGWPSRDRCVRIGVCRAACVCVNVRIYMSVQRYTCVCVRVRVCAHE